MNWSLILFVLFLKYQTITTNTFYSVGQLTKNNYINVTGNDYCVYLDTNEFGNSGEVKIKVTTYFSFFMEKFLYYGGNDKIAWQNELNNKLSFESYDASNPYYVENANIYYYECNLVFKIPLSSTQRYIYISIPKFSMYSNAHLTEIRVVGGLSAGGIAGIIIAVIVVIAIAIIAFIFYRKKKAGSISSPLVNNSPTATGSNNYNPPAIV